MSNHESIPFVVNGYQITWIVKPNQLNQAFHFSNVHGMLQVPSLICSWSNEYPDQFQNIVRTLHQSQNRQSHNQSYSTGNTQGWATRILALWTVFIQFVLFNLWYTNECGWRSNIKLKNTIRWSQIISEIYCLLEIFKEWKPTNH